jgi:hypothetical protein
MPHQRRNERPLVVRSWAISNPAEVPNHEPVVELPDGGGVRLLDQAPSMNTDAEVSDKIVVIGSARAALAGLAPGSRFLNDSADALA